MKPTATFSPLDLHRSDAGGLIGFSEWSAVGAAINLGTWGVPGWGLSHIAILAGRPDDTRDRLLSWESTTLCPLPCAMQGRRVSGVQAHHVRARVRTYPGKVWYYPLAEPLSGGEQERLVRFCSMHLGVPYDFAQAIGSRDTLLAWALRRWSPEDLHALFCSEFCAAALRAVGRLHTDNCSAWSPNRLARHVVRQRICLPPTRWK